LPVESRTDIEKANREYIRIEIKANLEANHEKTLESIKQDPKLEELQTQLSILEETIANHPIKDLIKYTNKLTGELPEVTGKATSKFAQTGDQMMSERGIENTEEARNTKLDEYRNLKSKELETKHAIQIKKLEVRDKVKEAQDEEILNNLADKEEQHISKILGDEAKKEERIARIKAAEQESAKKLADETYIEDLRRTAIKKAIRDEKRSRGFVAKVRAIFGPIANTDATTRKIYTEWVAKKLTAKEIANQTENSFKDRGFDSMNDIQEIMEYQAGKKTSWIKEFFDDIWTQGKRRGLDTYYREDYFTQVYKESPRVIKEKIAEFLQKEGGLSKDEAQSYVDGDKELPQYVAIRLKMTPSFVKTRVFPDYATAIRYGLTPKFMTIPQHFAYYVEEMEKVIANNEMIEDFIKNHKFLDVKDAPQSWIEVKVPGAAKRQWYASPDLANALNKQFQLDTDLSLLEWVGKASAGVSDAMTTIVLSGGVPYTPINYFAVGQVIKSLTTGVGALAKGDIPVFMAELRVAKAFVRTFSDSQSIKWMEKRASYIEAMGRQGINVEDRIGVYDELYSGLKKTWFSKNTYKNVYNSITTGKDNLLGLMDSKKRIALFGTDNDHKISTFVDMFAESQAFQIASSTFEEAFSRKTFNSFMPQMQIEIFISTYKQAIKSGLGPQEAEVFAGQVVKNEFGLITQLGRSRAVQNAIASIALAPRFRESLVFVYSRVIKGSTTQIKNPAFKNNRAFALGTIISFAMYQLINYLLNDEFTWENEDGRKFSIKIKLPNGDLAYVEFMPSVFATPRIAAQAGIALGTGDISEAGHQLSGFLSMPLTLVGDSITNKDHFGRPIYKEEDSTKLKYAKSVAHIGSGFVHPYGRELYKYFRDKQPLYQAFSIMAEIPLKYSNVGREAQSKFFNAQEVMTEERKKALTKFKPTYEKITEMRLAGDNSQATDAYNALSTKDQELFKSLFKSDKTKASLKQEREIFSTVKRLKELVDKGQPEAAQRLYSDLSDEEKKAFDKVYKKFYPKAK